MTLGGERMQRYPKYKASGIEWLGEIPEHWKVKKLKHLSTIVLGKMLTPEDKGGYYKKPYLRAKNVLWEKVDVSDVKEMWFSEQELNKYRLNLYDILVSEGGEVGRAGIWRNEIEECYIQNSVHKVTINQDYNPFYFLYLFLVYGRVGHFDAIIERVSIGHLTREKLTEVFCLVPSFPEQHAIATYLDHKTSQIDTYIAKKQQQIALLQKYRTAIINQAVTKGLNPAAPMKESGIEWLGKIPAHWEVKKLKHFSKIVNGSTPKTGVSEYWDGDIVSYIPHPNLLYLRIF
jgi:type I restriction enzyme S subunit